MIRLIEILRKKVFPTKENKNKVYFQDVDNLYPNRIKGLIENSPTAFRSANLMAKYIVGRGLADESLYDITIDKGLNLDVYDFSNVLAKQIAYHNGFFVHVSYKYKDGQIVPSNSRVIPFEDGRISRTDDDGYFGKLLVKDWENTGSFGSKTQKTKELYSFTKDQDDLIEQIKDNWKNEKKDKEFNLEEAIKIFKGQYYYYNPNIGDIYPLSKIHAVMGDCDTESRISNYTNVQFRKGFLGKTIILHNGVTDEDEDETAKVFEDFLGDENSGNMVYLPVNELSDGQSLEDIVKVVQLSPQYDEKFISETVPRLEDSIMASFNNIPKSLIKVGEGAMFGENADKYNELKRFYSEQNDEERKALQKFFFDVYDLDIEYITFGSELSDVVEQQEVEENA